MARHVVVAQNITFYVWTQEEKRTGDTEDISEYFRNLSLCTPSLARLLSLLHLAWVKIKSHFINRLTVGKDSMTCEEFDYYRARAALPRMLQLNERGKNTYGHDKFTSLWRNFILFYLLCALSVCVCVCDHEMQCHLTFKCLICDWDLWLSIERKMHCTTCLTKRVLCTRIHITSISFGIVLCARMA